NLAYYFDLKRTNDSLIKANEKLYNRLKQDFEMPDTVNLSVIDTIKVVDLTGQPRVERELALITIFYQKGTRAEITNIGNIFRGKIVDINNKTITLEITGPPEKIEAAINVLDPYGIKEMARSGTVALKRGEQLKKETEESLQTQ
ncbi:MAG: acetolactate synthase small subunit, partial [Ignavibacteriaceae bacterium]